MILSEVRIEEIQGEIVAIKEISKIVKREFPDLSVDQVHATAVELMSKTEESFSYRKLIEIESKLVEMNSIVREVAVKYLTK